MMYSEKMAFAIKCNGKVLREFKDTVYVPFGSEYTILIKNLNAVRALVKVEVDGQDVGNGTKFVVQANSSFELERSVVNNNLSQGNRFKFIERTSNIEDHRGIGVSDGLVRISFQFEKAPQQLVHPSHHPFHNTWHSHLIGSPTASTAVLRSVRSASTVTASLSAATPTSDVGITVPGSVSDQTFQSVSSFSVEDQTHVMVMKMLGETASDQVTEPVTVKAKTKCVTCGKFNKATAKFCSECGTALVIV